MSVPDTSVQGRRDAPSMIHRRGADETPELIAMFDDGDDLLDGMGFEHPNYKDPIRG